MQGQGSQSVSLGQQRWKCTFSSGLGQAVDIAEINKLECWLRKCSAVIMKMLAGMVRRFGSSNDFHRKGGRGGAITVLTKKIIQRDNQSYKNDLLLFQLLKMYFAFQNETIIFCEAILMCPAGQTFQQSCGCFMISTKT